MRLRFTIVFEKDYKKLHREIQNRLDKQLIFLIENPRYPSLRTKKVKGHPYIWEGRITKSYRFTFQIIDDVYVMRRTGTHDILNKP